MTTEAPSETASEFRAGDYALPAIVKRNEQRVKRSFWTKLARVAGRIPFAEDAVAMYYCALDPATPFRVRATLLAALAYFVLPADLIPDIIAGVGFTDDASVIAAALSMVASHITPTHRDKARKAFDGGAGQPQGGPD